MATADQLKALVDSHGSGDDARFRAVMTQIAAAMARRGRQKAAEELRSILDAVPRQDSPTRRLHVGPARPVPIAQPPRELSGIIVASYPKTRLNDMVLADPLRAELERVVAEYRRRDRLRSHGLEPRRKLLLVGPPGVGKTMTAAALAGECGLPLLAVQLHALMSKFMGETAVRLNDVFEGMKQTAGVYLFDELDAIGGTRGRSNDVGEARRVLNSFLQFLERDNADGLVIAATNLASLLDSALFRRFDAILHYNAPGKADVDPLVRNRLAPFDLTSVDWSCVVRAGVGLCHADVVRSAEEAAKGAVLAGRTTIGTNDLVAALESRRAARSAATGEACSNERSASPSDP